MGRGLLAILFAGAGTMHLIRPQPFIDIVPPIFPNAHWLVLLSGLAEIAGALGILIPITRKVARWGVIALLVAVFPANIYMATRQIQPAGIHIPTILLWARLPLQALLIWWVIAVTRTKQPKTLSAFAKES